MTHVTDKGLVYASLYFMALCVFLLVQPVLTPLTIFISVVLLILSIVSLSSEVYLQLRNRSPSNRR